ncbi:hypothetical protein PCH_Pc21g16560 [Penicillium rubens Wisconsin 54-1255]|uniref:Uncharacterized protein n=1 Tax=Penicillium rubens (strain ATCC 28089 / DSM 1075 / NRRL 1951 / Wisconsin 54-1255) TaxID=500485 RepID=B6HLD2_PENRW|nr:hypothetical protein PCH_Pc21g16560 [Penicillium rubens Wisconsin 54-1255]
MPGLAPWYFLLPFLAKWMRQKFQHSRKLTQAVWKEVSVSRMGGSDDAESDGDMLPSVAGNLGRGRMFYGWEAFQPKYHRDKIEHRCSIRTMPETLVRYDLQDVTAIALRIAEDDIMWCGAYGKALAPVLKRVKMREKRVDLRCNAFGREPTWSTGDEKWWKGERMLWHLELESSQKPNNMGRSNTATAQCRHMDVDDFHEGDVDNELRFEDSAKLARTVQISFKGCACDVGTRAFFFALCRCPGVCSSELAGNKLDDSIGNKRSAEVGKSKLFGDVDKSDRPWSPQQGGDPRNLIGWTLKVEGVARGGLLEPADCPEAEARHGQTGSGLSKWFIEVGIEVGGRSGLIDQSADCPEAEARHGQTGMGLSRWLIRSADCPEAEARHGQTGSGCNIGVARHGQTGSGLSSWFIGVDGSLDQPADCPEAEARHGQTGSAEARHGQTGRDQSADCPEAEGPATVVDGSGLIDQSADCPEAEARHGQTGRGLSGLPIVLKPKGPPRSDWKWLIGVVDRSGLSSGLTAHTPDMGGSSRWMVEWIVDYMVDLSG